MRTLLPAPSPAGTAPRLRRALIVASVALVAVATVGAVALVGLRLARSGVLPGVHVADLPVGGMGDAELAGVLAAHAEQREGAQVTLTLRDVRVDATAHDVGYRLDATATADAVMRRGRQANPLAALIDHLRAFGGATTVEPVQRVDPARLDAWLADATDRLGQFPVEGTLRFDGAQITRVDPLPGVTVRPDTLRDPLRTGLLTPGDVALAVQDEPVEPETTTAAVDGVLAEAQRAVAAPVVLSREAITLTFTPDDIGEVLAVAREGGDLRLAVDADRLAAAIPAPTIAALDTDPVDATFLASGGSVTLQASRDGFRFDPEVVAAQLLALATGSGPRDAELEGEVVEPDLTTAEAEALGVVERVSTFTTNFTAGQSRVTNIQRIADMVDGVLLRPGETFSVNGHVGERTTAKGFVGGGAIFDGEFVEQIGGGVSQFATTMYNAAYFGGYAIPQHKAHSYFISRYPVGREATLNFPDVDLRIRNTSPHGALIVTSHTSTSVTVSIYGTRWVEVDSITGEQTNVTPPEVRVRENEELPAGAERIVQSGREGFSITVTRILRFPGGREEREPTTTRYLPEPRIVERGVAPEEDLPDEQEPTEAPTLPPE